MSDQKEYERRDLSYRKGWIRRMPGDIPSVEPVHIPMSKSRKMWKVNGLGVRKDVKVAEGSGFIQVLMPRNPEGYTYRGVPLQYIGNGKKQIPPDTQKPLVVSRKQKLPKGKPVEWGILPRSARNKEKVFRCR